MSDPIRNIRVDLPVNENLEVYDYLVVDRSGSMSSVKTSTINGINGYLRNLRESSIQNKVKATYVSLLLFDHRFIKLYDFVPIEEVRELTADDFVPEGWTALHDAIGLAIDDLETRLKGRESSSDVNVTITSFTDGFENRSQKYPSDNGREGGPNAQLAGRITEIQNMYKWTIASLAAGTQIQAEATAKGLNIPTSNTKAYHASNAGTLQAFSLMSNARSRSMTRSISGQNTTTHYFADDIVDTLAAPIVTDHFPTTTIPTHTYLPSPHDNTSRPSRDDNGSGSTTGWFSSIFGGGNDSGFSSYDSGGGDSGGGDGGGGGD